jgi:DNA-binding MarR family transcriptional regulator
MNRYMLSNEGRARARRRKISVKAEMAKTEGYEVLDYLYEHGAGTVEEIANHTGLSQGHVMDKLLVFINHGFVEESAY